MIDSLRLMSARLSRPIDFIGCTEIAPRVASILRGWNISTGPVEASPEPLVRIEKDASGFRWLSDTGSLPTSWARTPARTAFEICIDLHVHLSGWHLRDAPSICLLHCAAVRMGGGLVVFPSTFKAGKSILAMQLASAGYMVFGDDLLMLAPDNRTGIALGMLPRLRLPLPDSLDGPARAFIASRRGYEDHARLYVELEPSELADFGVTAPVSGFVLLDRQAGGEAELSPVSQGEMMKFAIGRNFADGLTQIEIFDRFEAITRDRPRLRLRYARCEDAVALLARQFGGAK